MIRAQVAERHGIGDLIEVRVEVEPELSCRGPSHVALDRARRHRVDPDSLLAQFHCQSPRQADHAGLGRRIVRVAAVRAADCSRGDVHDATARSLEHRESRP